MLSSMVIKTIENMKEQFINEVADAMSEVLNFEQMVELNNALLQVISKYEIVDNGEKVREDVKSNNRILEKITIPTCAVNILNKAVFLSRVITVNICTFIFKTITVF